MSRATALFALTVWFPLAVASGQGSAFTYQGRLIDGGQAANGLYDMRFRLSASSDDPNGFIGPSVCVDGVTVADGLFTTELDFAATPFNGTPLWLSVELRADMTPGNCGVGAYSPLSPRQQVSPTPYALFAAKAGASALALPFDGEASVPIVALLDLENTRTTGNTYAGIFRVRSPVNDSRALVGLATGATGQTYGVWGEALSSSGVGVRGKGGGYGVWGEATNPSGYSGYFLGGRSYFAGNVGIGVTNPASAKLMVESSGSAIHARALAFGAGVYGEGYNGIEGVAIDKGGFGGVFKGAGPLGSGNSLRVVGIGRIAGGLNIGGTSLVDAPAAKLQIENGSDAELNGGGFAVLGSADALNVAIDDNEILARDGGAAASLSLNRNGGDTLINSSGAGKVGIGTTTPAFKLDVNGATRPRGGLYFNGALDPHQNAQGGNFLSFGHPGFSEDHIWYYNNNFWFYDSAGGGDTEHPNIQASDFYTISDIRLKTEIEPIPDALHKVLRLQGLSYRFDGAKVDPSAVATDQAPRRRLGFAAQEVAQVAPEAVSYSPELDVHSVSYGSLVPLLVEAIKEQQAQIDALQEQITALKSSSAGRDSPR